MVRDALSGEVVQIASTSGAFAALKTDGSVITWGDVTRGGAAWGEQLKSGVYRITGAMDAFAAVKLDGSVVTWGYASRGGDSSAVQAELCGSSSEENDATSYTNMDDIEAVARLLCYHSYQKISLTAP